MSKATEERDRRRTVMFELGLTTRVIAQIEGVHVNTIADWRKHRDIKPNLHVKGLKGMIEVTREFVFDSAHHLHNYRGMCANLHGHTYRLQVTVGGEPDADGMIVDFGTLKEIVNSVVIDKLDHKYLNDILPFNPTAENMVKWIFNQLKSSFYSSRTYLASVKLWETPNSFAEYRG